MMTEQNTRLYYPIQEVLSSKSFYWIGRGGYSITHSGNVYVRSIIAQHANRYMSLKRADRNDLCTRLLENEFVDMKFVIPRDKLLANLARDDDNQKASGARRVGLSRRQSLMEKHRTIDQIKSYPDEVCIEVGESWTRDILAHQFREDAERKKSGSSASSGRVVSVTEPTKALDTTWASLKRCRSGNPAVNMNNLSSLMEPRPLAETTFGRPLEFDIPNTEHLDQLADTLFSDEAREEDTTDFPPTKAKRQRTLFQQQQLQQEQQQQQQPRQTQDNLWGKEMHDVECADMALFMSSFMTMGTSSFEPVDCKDFSWGSSSEVEGSSEWEKGGTTTPPHRRHWVPDNL